jgi:hypothetical protein
MTKGDLIVMINEMLNLYKGPLVASGVDITKYLQEFDRRTVPQIKEGYQWLLERAEVIGSYRKIRNLLSEEIWTRYEHMDTEDFREVVLLKVAITEIKKAFTGRPALFRKAKDASKCKRHPTTTGND